MTKTLQELQTSFDRSDTVGAVALGVLFLIMVVMILYLTRYGQTIAEHWAIITGQREAIADINKIVTGHHTILKSMSPIVLELADKYNNALIFWVSDKDSFEE